MTYQQSNVMNSQKMLVVRSSVFILIVFISKVVLNQEPIPDFSQIKLNKKYPRTETLDLDLDDWNDVDEDDIDLTKGI